MFPGRCFSAKLLVQGPEGVFLALRFASPVRLLHQVGFPSPRRFRNVAFLGLQAGGFARGAGSLGLGAGLLLAASNFRTRFHFSLGANRLRPLDFGALHRWLGERFGTCKAGRFAARNFAPLGGWLFILRLARIRAADSVQDRCKVFLTRAVLDPLESHLVQFSHWAKRDGQPVLEFGLSPALGDACGVNGHVDLALGDGRLDSRGRRI